MSGTEKYDWDAIRFNLEQNAPQLLSKVESRDGLADLLPEHPSGSSLCRHLRAWGWGSSIHDLRMHFGLYGKSAKESGEEELKEQNSFQIMESERKEAQRLILGENRRLRAENERLRGLNALVIEAVEQTLARIPTFEPPPPRRSPPTRSPESVCLLLSDLHMGERVRPEDAADLGEHSWDVMLEKMDLLRESVLEIVDIERAARSVDVLNIFNLGDLVTNEDIYVGQSRDIDRNLVDQIFEGAEAIVQKILLPFLREFTELRMFSIYGNHGRLSSKKGEKHRRSNADYILSHVLRIRLQDFSQFKSFISQAPFIGFSLPEAPDFNHLLIHGDEVRSYMTLPYYGLERAVMRYISATSVLWHYCYLGHFHRAAEIDLSHGETIINGSWIGPTEYSISSLQQAAQAKQVLFGFHPMQGKTWTYDINLSLRPHLERDEKGFYTPIFPEERLESESNLVG